MTLVYLVAGEASGDVLGARLIAALRAARPDLTFAGIGGARMAEQGLVSLFPMQDLALMGLLEVIPQLRRLRARLAQTVADITARRPDIVVTIDAPGFTLRLLRRIAGLGLKRVHYVAPQVWAWREGRVRKFPGLWDELLCLLPFEPAFFARHGLHARFVGHPVLESGADQGDGARFRAAHGIAPDVPILLLLPGSRRGEVSRLLPTYQATLSLLLAQFPRLQPVLIAAPGVLAQLQASLAVWEVPPILVTDVAAKHDAYAAANAALSKSGTSTVELALAGVPMVVAYRVNRLTAEIARRLVRVRYASLVNLLADRLVVPELLQENCVSDRLADALVPLLLHGPEAQRQRADFRDLAARLRPPAGTPSQEAAAAVLAVLDAR